MVMFEPSIVLTEPLLSTPVVIRAVDYNAPGYINENLAISR